MFIMCNDMNQSMFEGPVSTWSENQIELTSWCRYYNAHYFSLPEEEQPNDRVFKYNPLFDAYIKRKIYKQKEEARQSRNKSAGKGKQGGQSMKWEF